MSIVSEKIQIMMYLYIDKWHQGCIYFSTIIMLEQENIVLKICFKPTPRCTLSFKNNQDKRMSSFKEHL